ncbi:pyridine nucleotide-disulfide oxidoreductase [Lentibacillus kapialis]|uniref:Pyridine nucleotide-disulfide oxidoreductase n=1 Tax=Lentibacillus kapialis TaxID=340214 RepID=A0A917Q308_9BACI|nr:FAD/NAD(P)-binding oxidoreductase [Lentibacillus kapialis]GGK08780.1 pyridine nucleotide-disulfide oxidoreductase [Lentibacillus kapialis]
MNFHQVVIVGGGTAGITVAARLKRLARYLDIAIIDPASKHYYQPLWTLVGAGIFDKKQSERSESQLIPEGVQWYQEPAEEFQPEDNAVVTAEGTKIYYKYLVVCPGLQLDWNKIEGLEGNVGTYGICSNYSYEHVDYTWEAIRTFKGGRAIFTHPNSPVKCAGAPQKIMYLAEDAFRQQGVRDQTEVVFQSAKPSIFSVEKYANTLNDVIHKRGIQANYKKDLIKIDGPNKKATFRYLDTDEEETLDYDMIHAVPYMSAPDFIKRSPLANADGWVDVDPYTLQHNQYSNVFSLGDASSVPTSKTGAAIRKQAPAVVSNVYAMIKNKEPWRKYNGYTSCPLVTSYNSLVMAEFKYNNVPSETFPVNQGKERKSMYVVKKYGLPAMYWHGMMKGRM